MFTELLLIVFFPFFNYVSSQRREAKQFLVDYNKNFVTYMNAKTKAMFARSVNITEFNIKQEAKENDKYRMRIRQARREARKFDLSDSDEDTRRQFKLLLSTKQPRNSKVAKQLEDLGNEMRMTYENITVPFDPAYIKSSPKILLDLNSLNNIMASSTDPNELSYVWKSWRKATSSRLRNKYEMYVKLNNIGARENNYSDAGEYYRSFYEVNDLQTVVETLLNGTRHLYLELHGYIRYHLAKLYPTLIDPKGPIPAHLLGDLWGQTFEGLYNRVIPYPQEPSIDVTPSLSQNKTVKEMLKMTEEFFTSLGWEKLPETFWKKSLFEKPLKRKVECIPSALDLMGEINGKPDVRIKMCIKKTQRDFIMIHHEIGHVYYDLFYRNQPFSYRNGANPGFHEATGDFVGLSVQTPAHLYAIGLQETNSQTREADINFLLKTALQQIAFLPFAYVVDNWRWKVYNEDIKPWEYNKKWWKYREKYQGISNPVQNSDKHFDPLSIYHIAGDVPYIRYFFATIFMFTFHKRACDLSSNTKPLYQCSIYNSKRVGKVFGKMLALGSSKPWEEAIKQFTGSSKLSVNPIKEYFRPLSKWLQDYRRTHNYTIGWNSETELA